MHRCPYRQAKSCGQSFAIDRMRDELIKARILRQIARRHRGSDIAEAEPEKSLPDVPLHKRGFGVMADYGQATRLVGALASAPARQAAWAGSLVFLPRRAQTTALRLSSAPCIR
jgi:hypothetical protein